MNNLCAWTFLLEIAERINLNEGINGITAIISDKRFRTARAFQEVLDFSFKLDRTNDMVQFWQACLSYIDEVPHASAMLLKSLIRARPGKWHDCLSNETLMKALVIYYKEQINAWGDDGKKHFAEEHFAELAQNLSKIISSDEEYWEGIEILKNKGTAEFLIDTERIERISLTKQKEHK